MALPPLQAFWHLFTANNSSTQWLEDIPVIDGTTESCVTAPITNWISRLGLHNLITSERGLVFTSDLWIAVTTYLSLQTQVTTTYNPEARRMVQRFHRILKATVIASCSTPLGHMNFPESCCASV